MNPGTEQSTWGGPPAADPHMWFSGMVEHCRGYARVAHENGRPVVGIMCEYAPREVIMAAGAVPVCLCGGDADTIALAEQHLPASVCPLIKSTYGYFIEKSNPFLEMADLVVAETTCDGKKKMFELMAEARPTYMMELPQKENDPDAMASWTGELRKLIRFLEERYSVSIDDAALRSAIAMMNRERGLRRELAGLMKSDSPPFTGRQLLDFKSIISGQIADLEQYEACLSFWKNGRGRQSGNGIEDSAAPRARVLLT
jgi:benzoyl-CoA reductase/2-hydroxyglutaryl-CoA dehydratase subunit BcrC/BadD/HgdB